MENKIKFKDKEIKYLEIDGRVWLSFNHISEILKKPNLYKQEDITIIDDVQYISSTGLKKNPRKK